MTIVSETKNHDNYLFRIPFSISPSEYISVLIPVLVIEDTPNSLVTIETGTDLPIEKSNRLSMVGKRYDTIEKALSSAEKALDALTIVSMKNRLGIEVSREKTIHEARYTDINGSEVCVGFNELPGINIYPDIENAPMHSLMGMATRFGVPGENFAESIRSNYGAHCNLESLGEAYDLYISSHFESSQTARFLTQITCIECLAIDSRRNEDEVKAIDELISKVSEIDASTETVNRLKNQLGQMKRKPISATCYDLVESRLGREDAERFKELYRIRSKIIHNGSQWHRDGRSRKIWDIDQLVSRLLLTFTAEETP